MIVAVLKQQLTTFSTSYTVKIPHRTPLRDDVRPHLQAILDAPDEQTTRILLRKITDNALYEDKAPETMSTLQASLYDAMAVLLLPEKYRGRLRTTNSIQKLNEELWRQEEVMSIFVKKESVMRLPGALLMEQIEKWTVAKQHFDTEEYFKWRKSRISTQTHNITRTYQEKYNPIFKSSKMRLYNPSQGRSLCKIYRFLFTGQAQSDACKNCSA